MLSASDASGAITAFCAFAAVVFGIFTFSRQKTGSDVATLVGLFDVINSNWDRHIVCDNEQLQDYYLGQILSYFEHICYLINKSIVSRSAAECVANHIADVWHHIESDARLKEKLEKISTNEETFREIRIYMTSRDKRKILQRLSTIWKKFL